MAKKTAPKAKKVVSKAKSSISNSKELAAKLQADRQIKILSATKKYETEKDLLAEKYHMSLAKLQTKLSSGIASLENEYQGEVGAIDKKFN
ncbi:MAG: hypothetical protein LBV53_02580 [Mycoplasmataceae bacterium]|nr:hypothetical protein [Mycoplasmataceae bacterium]